MSVQDFVNSARVWLRSGDPGRNLISILVIILAVSAVIAVVVYLVHVTTPKGRIEAMLRGKAQEQAKGPDWLVRLLAVLLVVLAFVGMGRYMSRPQGCRQCHGRAWTASLAQSPHKDVACMSCHGSPGITGPARDLAAYGRWVAVYTATRQVAKAKGTGIYEGACLDCHPEVPTSTRVRNGIRVRHKEFLVSGVTCADCHNLTSHPDVVSEPTKPSMSGCLICHNGDRASAACETCHVRDAALRALPRGFAKVHMTQEQQKGSCFKCHKQAPCIVCHGIRMPHPPGWAGGSVDQRTLHAREAFTNRQVCWRCHFRGTNVFSPNPDACKPCHEPGMATKMHGGPVWISEHGLEATGKKTGVLAVCFGCHSTTLCDQCHPASYRKRYKPRQGPDQYQRAVPLNPSLVP